MNNLVLHPVTRAQLERLAAQPPHALLVIAPDGSGKRTVAETLVRQLLGLNDQQELTAHPVVLYIEPHNKVISIEAIRDLQKGMQLKTIGTRSIRRAVIIEAAHRMTTEAQNALLKLLEEPPEDSILVLTVNSADGVLPTIYSRAQHITLKQLPSEELTTFFTHQGFTGEKVTEALRYSGQRVGLSDALLRGDATHPLLEATRQARQLLGQPVFERLQAIDEWVSHKEELPERLDALQRICQAGQRQAAEKDQIELLKRWKRYCQAVYDAIASLKHNPNAKLLLTHLFMQLS